MLQSFPLFSELEESELQMISEKMEEVEIEPGQELLVQNEDAQAVYFLKEGSFKVLVNGEMVAQIDKPQCFGEMSCLIPDTPVSATVKTAKKSHVLKISRENFLEVVNHIPKIWKTLFLQMNGRFKSVNMRLSEVLEHTPQGLIKVDKDGVITNEYSHECTHYFANENLSGISFPELTIPSDAEKQETWKESFTMLFDEEEALPFQDLAGLLDQELKYTLPTGEVKEFVLSYYPCKGVDGKKIAIDVGVEDVTEARELERKNETMEMEQRIMGKVYENPDSFMNLRKYVVSTLSELLQLTKKLKGVPPSDLKKEFEITMRKLHSLKGYSGLFALKPVAQACHDLETLVKECESMEQVDRDQLVKLIDGVKVLKEKYYYTDKILNNIGAGLRKRIFGVPFTAQEFDKLKKATSKKDFKTIQKLIQSAEKVEAIKLVDNWEEEINRLCEKLGKQAEFKIDGEGGQIPKHIFNQLDKTLVHLLRNCIDHGIEDLNGRLDAGKSEVGSVQVTIDADDQNLRFKIEDDGRGIDFSELPKLARSKPNLDKAAIEQFESEGSAWKILFMPGFSTAKEVTDVSGRGVGLDAVHETVEEMGGNIEVESSLGASTVISIEIPGVG